jgi:hypothetical protein
MDYSREGKVLSIKTSLAGCGNAPLKQYFTLPGLFHMESMEWRVESMECQMDSMEFPMDPIWNGFMES